MRARATSVGSGAGLVGRSTTVTAGLLCACQAVRIRGILFERLFGVISVSTSLMT